MSAKRQGANPKELEDLIELPEQLRECWYWFLCLNSTRPVGFGFSAISYAEIKSYFELMRIDVDPAEIEVIKMFDRIAQDFNAKKQEKNNNKKNK